MADIADPCCKQTKNNCVTQRQHFNYLRNNSCQIWGAFSWGNNEAPIQNQNINIRDHYQNIRSQQNQIRNYDQSRKEQVVSQGKGNRRVSFDDTSVPRGQQVQIVQGGSKQGNLNANARKDPRDQKNRPASAFQKKSRLVKDEEAERIKNEQNKQKVMNYIEELRPYTRGLSNTKFQDYFGKAAPQCYGRANTNQPIGGIIYGNHLKTFNVNPHVFTNHPEYYQTHTTALNYGKRAKVCEDQKWRRLQKQLSKKLGLKQKNETIKQGKQVVYVDVDDNNKYQVMRQNHEFQKANRQQIHNREVEFKKEKHQQYLDDINQYYAKKKQKIADNLSTRQSLDMTGSNLSPEEYQAKLNQQTIYRYHDKNGNVRLAADRHGMTCYVDMNFPENQAAYVQQLKDRMPIFPIRVEGEDRNIDAIRKQNCKKGHEEVYPSHYLLRNCEEPQVLKMLSNKTGVDIRGGKTQNQGRVTSNNANSNVNVNNRKVGVNSPTGNIANKSFVSTAGTQNLQGGQGQRRGGNLDRTNDYDDQNWGQNQGRNQYDIQNQRNNARDNCLRTNKSEIIDRAWGNRQLAGEIAGVMNQTCCITQHLPHNELNPQCYKSSGASLSKVPFAG